MVENGQKGLNGRSLHPSFPGPTGNLSQVAEILLRLGRSQRKVQAFHGSVVHKV